MDVRMRQILNQAAGTALTAGLQAGSLTQDELRQPERKPLLAHTLLPGDEQDLGQALRSHGDSEHPPLLGVAEEGI
jgi:hypothetical protein